MALTGVHITAGYVGGDGASRVIGATRQASAVQLARKASWSQTMASAGTTAAGAPSKSEIKGEPCFEVRSSADIYVAIGTAPDASQAAGTGDTARVFVPANETRNIICDAGDKLAWVLA